MCAYGHVHVQGIQDQPAVINSSCSWTTVTVVAGHGGFYNRYNDNQYAVGIYTDIASRARALQAMASWPTAVLWDLVAYFLIQNASWSALHATSLLKAMCIVTVIFIVLPKNFHVFNFCDVYCKKACVNCGHVFMSLYTHCLKFTLKCSN